MNRIVFTALAATALVGFAGAAQAQSTHSSSSTTYSNGLIQGLNTAPPISIFGIPITGPAAAQNAWNLAQTPGANALGIQQQSGSRYHQESTAPNDTETAQQSLSNDFTLTGDVSKDCSFYGGGTTGHTINLGQIGIRTGDNDNVSIAFNQATDMSANVNSATAGCNFNNTVTINKANGTVGLRNQNPGGFDPQQFTDRIPYSVAATWTGADVNAQNSVAHTLTVADTAGGGSLNTGAWRSEFNMDVNMPAQTKGLVAGTYKDTITVTLATL